jgi:uncharacterized membrane protein
MLSARLPPDTLVNAKTNMVWDGLFHALTWVATAISIGMLWQAVKRRDVPLSGHTFFGSLVLGWGVFNLVEGIIDHYILGIHHVVELRGLSVYDHLFLASGALFILTGWAFIRKGKQQDVPAYRS